VPAQLRGTSAISLGGAAQDPAQDPRRAALSEVRHQDAHLGGGLPPVKADNLRFSMARFKAKGKVSQLEQNLIRGILAKGYTLNFTQRIFRHLEDYGSNGFPETHAASIAQLVRMTCWIKYNYPYVFSVSGNCQIMHLSHSLTVKLCAYCRVL
jgi:hypothetical protein